MSRRVLIIPAVLLLVLTGCVPSEPDVDPETGEGLVAAAEYFQGLSADDQLAAVARTDAAAERELWTATGIEEELGGEEAADEVFAEMQQALAGRTEEVGEDDSPFELMSFGVSNFDQAVGAGMYGNMTIGDILNQLGMDRTKNGEEGSDSSKPGDDSQVSIDSKNGTVTTSYESTTTIKGIKVTLRVKSEITPCPDPDGKVHAEGTYTLIVSAPNGRGLTSEVTVKDDITVDDDARQAGSEYSYYVEHFDTGQGSEILSWSVDTKKNATVNSGEGASAAAQAAAMKTGAFFSSWIAGSLERAAQKGWESGRCITMNMSYSAGPAGLDPDQKVSVTVSPVAKSDGRPAGGTVTAKLTAGAKSITPSGEKVKADANFSYTAPPEKEKDGTVHFEARSKRGVGIIDVTFDTKGVQAYKVVPVTNLVMTGVICDITKPFDIAGGGLTVHHTPTSDKGGTYTLDGTIGGIPWTGNGTYTVALANDKKSGTLVIDGTSTGYAPAGTVTKPAHEVVELVATKSCSG